MTNIYLVQLLQWDNLPPFFCFMWLYWICLHITLHSGKLNIFTIIQHFMDNTICWSIKKKIVDKLINNDKNVSCSPSVSKIKHIKMNECILPLHLFSAAFLLFICGGDEECVDTCVLMMSDLDDEFWDSQPDVVQ